MRPNRGVWLRWQLVIYVALMSAFKPVYVRMKASMHNLSTLCAYHGMCWLEAAVKRTINLRRRLALHKSAIKHRIAFFETGGIVR